METTSISWRLRALRERRNLSQEDLAQKLGFEDRQTLSDLELGGRKACNASRSISRCLKGRLRRPRTGELGCVKRFTGPLTQNRRAAKSPPTPKCRPGSFVRLASWYVGSPGLGAAKPSKTTGGLSLNEGFQRFT
jgi:DNA-binding XRE family transcriptional regulator